MEQLLISWVLALSLASFVLMGWDKRQARRDGWRVPERTLFLTALLGGSPGAVLGMFFFRHKTKHWYFRYGLPAILLAQAALLAWLIFFASKGR
ncbi:MAG: DUF1294 domain-containing protein [Oscillospiraceae bacterium]|nr:DUF1294 domain-containing protein [Oscillospiraceae bacterium]